MVKVTKKCPFTGKMNTRNLRTTKKKIDLWESKQVSALIQDYFSELGPDDREFILTGCTPEMWDKFITERDDFHG